MPATEDALQRNYVGAGGQLGRGAGSDARVVVKVQPRRRSYGEEKEAPGSRTWHRALWMAKGIRARTVRCSC